MYQKCEYPIVGNHETFRTHGEGEGGKRSELKIVSLTGGKEDKKLSLNYPCFKIRHPLSEDCPNLSHPSFFTNYLESIKCHSCKTQED